MTSNQGFENEKNVNCSKLIGFFVTKHMKNLHSVNLLANRKPHLLFTLGKSKADIKKLIFHNSSAFKRNLKGRKLANIMDI